MSLLSMSLSGAVIILAVALIRLLVADRLPRATFLVLWGVALVRLLVPYSLSSALSIYSLFARPAIPAVNVVTVPVAALPLAPAAPAGDTTVINSAPTGTTLLAHSFASWTVVWVTGMLVCVAFFAAAWLRCRRGFREALPVEDAALRPWLSRFDLRRKVSVRYSDRVSTPLTYGVLHPVILLPKNTDWSDEEGLGYILAHEYVHIRRFDVLSKLALTVAVCVHWFDPAVWLMYVLANRDLELACDQAVIHALGDGAKRAYASTLIRMEEARSGLAPLCNHFSKNVIEERIVAIMKMRKTSLAALIAAAILVAGVTVAFATSAQTPKAQPAPAVEAEAAPAAEAELVPDGEIASAPVSPKDVVMVSDLATEEEAPVLYKTDWSWPLLVGEGQNVEYTSGDYCVAVKNEDGIVTMTVPGDSAHEGIDIEAASGQPVLAAMDGIVAETGYSAQWGNHIRLEHTEGRTSFYACLESIDVAEGQSVRRGEVIGTVGSTGMSTGPHLHFALYVADGTPQVLLSFPVMNELL